MSTPLPRAKNRTRFPLDAPIWDALLFTPKGTDLRAAIMWQSDEETAFRESLTKDELRMMIDLQGRRTTEFVQPMFGAMARGEPEVPGTSMLVTAEERQFLNQLAWRLRVPAVP